MNRPIFIPYYDVDTYDNIVLHVRHDYHSIDYPKLSFRGSHAIDGEICSIISPFKNDVYWTQSSHKILSDTYDQFGFCSWCNNNDKKIRHALFNISASILHHIDTNNLTASIDDYCLCIYGYFHGRGVNNKNIMKNIVNKQFIITDIELALIQNNKLIERKPINLSIIDMNFFNPKGYFPLITDYGQYECVIDFSKIIDAKNNVNNIFYNVKHSCPILDSYGYSFQESPGMIWKCYDKNNVYAFMIKDESKFTTHTDNHEYPNDITSMQQFCEYSINLDRCHKCLQQSFHDRLPQKNDLKYFSSWIIGNIYQEEFCILQDLNFDKKILNIELKKSIKNWFNNYINGTF